jgi:hypothetical protein
MTTIALVLSAALLGSMLLFLVVIAPTVFRSLEPDPAGAFLRAMFPKLYVWITVVAGAAAVATSVVWPVGGALLGGIAAGSAYSNWVLTPQINDARDAWKASDDAADHAAFERLHKRSTRIYGVQLLALVGVVLGLGG